MHLAESDDDWMQQALELARMAEAKGEVPVGALIVSGNSVIGQGFNRPISASDPTAHAEIIALRDAATRLNNYRMPGTTLYVTLEPCMMCAGAMVHARIDRLVYGASDPKTGVIDSHQQVFQQQTVNHRIAVTSGIMAEECGAMLSTFFRKRRRSN